MPVFNTRASWCGAPVNRSAGVGVHRVAPLFRPRSGWRKNLPFHGDFARFP